MANYFQNDRDGGSSTNIISALIAGRVNQAFRDIDPQSTLQSQNAVSAYFTRGQILPFGFAGYCWYIVCHASPTLV